MSQAFIEAIVEEDALVWLESLGYVVEPAPEIASGEPATERQDYGWLRDTLLPKLISGELRVKDAESIAEATA